MNKIDSLGLEIVKRNERCRLAAYEDTGGVWTIGWGHTPAKPGMKISQTTADEILLEDLAWAEQTVNGSTHDVVTTENQFSAMVSLAFNIGASAFRRSTVLRRHRSAEYFGAADAFLMWDQDNGQVLPGLIRRRKEERELYLKDLRVKILAFELENLKGFENSARLLQKELKDLGFYLGAVDGVWGPMSQAALTNWKKGT